MWQTIVTCRWLSNSAVVLTALFYQVFCLCFVMMCYLFCQATVSDRHDPNKSTIALAKVSFHCHHVWKHTKIIMALHKQWKHHKSQNSLCQELMFYRQVQCTCKCNDVIKDFSHSNIRNYNCYSTKLLPRTIHRIRHNKVPHHELPTLLVPLSSLTFQYCVNSAVGWAGSRWCHYRKFEGSSRQAVSWGRPILLKKYLWK